MKQCVNKECNSYIDDNDPWCKVCGTQQPEQQKKRGWGLIKKKPESIVQVKAINPNEFEDFRLAKPISFPQPSRQEQKSEVMQKLEQLEQQLAISLKNHNWLLMNVDNWLQGYKQKQEEEDSGDEEENAKNI